MKKLKILLLMLCLVFASITAAQAQPIVLGTFSVGSLKADILGTPTANGFSLSVQDTTFLNQFSIFLLVAVSTLTRRPISLLAWSILLLLLLRSLFLLAPFPPPSWGVAQTCLPHWV